MYNKYLSELMVSGNVQMFTLTAEYRLGTFKILNRMGCYAMFATLTPDFAGIKKMIVEHLITSHKK